MNHLDSLPQPVALVCGVGERNAPAQAGMLDAVMADGWRPAFSVGASVGGVVAAASIARPDGAPELAAQMWRDIVASGLVEPGWARIGAAMTGNDVPKVNRQWRKVLGAHLGDAAFDPEGRDAMVSLELPQGTAWITDRGPLVDAVIAAAAFPVFVNPITLSNSTLIDGGFIAPVPVLQAMARGAASAVILSAGKPAVDSEVIAPSRWYDVVLSAIRAQVGAKASHDIAVAGLKIPIVIVDVAKPDVIHWADVDRRITAGRESAAAQLIALAEAFPSGFGAPGVYAVAPEITEDLRLSGALAKPQVTER